MKTTTILKFSIILFAAMLSVSAAAQNFSRYMASEPQAQQPAVISPMAHQPMVKDPSANQPVASVRDYERAQRNINVNAAAYNVNANNRYGGSSAAPLSAAPARRGGVLGGGSASAGNASFGATVGVNTGITSSNNVAGVGTVFSAEGTTTTGSWTPGGKPIGSTDVPLGTSLIPLLLMLLCYALFRLVRGEVREEQEMA